MAIGIKAQGRTGNRMFQFAFGYSLSKKLNTSFFIEKLDDLSWFEFYDEYYLKNKFSFFRIRLKHIIKKIFFSIEENTYQSLKVVEMNGWSACDDRDALFANNTFFDGYFQSVDYFKNSFEEIKKIFTVKKYFQNEFASTKSEYLKEKYIAIHIRRSDYIDWELEGLGEKNYSLPVSYYLNCFKQINDFNKYKIVFLSDDEDFSRINFSHIANFVFERNSVAIDFQILQHAEIVILSNSSLAWWAAFLSFKAKKIFAPEYWLGFKVKKEFPKNIINNDWIKVSV